MVKFIIIGVIAAILLLDYAMAKAAGRASRCEENRKEK